MEEDRKKSFKIYKPLCRRGRTKNAEYDTMNRPGVTSQRVRWSGCTARLRWGKPGWRRRQISGDSACSSELKQIKRARVHDTLYLLHKSQHSLQITTSLEENASLTVNGIGPWNWSWKTCTVVVLVTFIFTTDHHIDDEFNLSLQIDG